jgi:hypothetical protein
VLRKIEPRIKGDLARLPQYIELFKREFVEDTRTFAFNVIAEPGTRGSVEPDGLRRVRRAPSGAWWSFSDTLALDAQNNIELLPSTNLAGKPFAIVRKEHCYL